MNKIKGYLINRENEIVAVLEDTNVVFSEDGKLISALIKSQNIKPTTRGYPFFHSFFLDKKVVSSKEMRLKLVLFTEFDITDCGFRFNNESNYALELLDDIEIYEKDGRHREEIKR